MHRETVTALGSRMQARQPQIGNENVSLGFGSVAFHAIESSRTAALVSLPPAVGLTLVFERVIKLFLPFFSN